MWYLLSGTFYYYLSQRNHARHKANSSRDFLDKTLFLLSCWQRGNLGVGVSKSTGKADSLMTLFLGKERVIIRSADWQKKLVEKPSTKRWPRVVLPTGTRSLSSCVQETNSELKEYFKSTYSSKDTYGTWKVLRIIYGTLRVDATISMCLTIWSGWSFSLKFFLRASQPHWFLKCAGRGVKWNVVTIGIR
jgi:hypothetical protein